MDLGKKVEALIVDFIANFTKKVSSKYNISETELQLLWTDEKTTKSTEILRCSHKYTKGSQVGQQCQSKVSGGSETKCSRHRNQKVQLQKPTEEKPIVDLVEKFASQDLNVPDSEESDYN